MLTKSDNSCCLYRTEQQTSLFKKFYIESAKAVALFMPGWEKHSKRKIKVQIELANFI